mmetsp:Transcript_1182/g.2944  ORF Transcript_1182/g.2944 Transcript_1182/m.2944 type:complete len:517 (+) Transcript_1182:191-1741(+)
MSRLRQSSQPMAAPSTNNNHKYAFNLALIAICLFYLPLLIISSRHLNDGMDHLLYEKDDVDFGPPPIVLPPENNAPPVADTVESSVPTALLHAEIARLRAELLHRSEYKDGTRQTTTNTTSLASSKSHGAREDVLPSSRSTNTTRRQQQMFAQAFLYDNKVCRIVPPMQFINCGCEGHLYKADMICPSTSRGTAAKVLPVVVKVFTETDADRGVTEYTTMMDPHTLNRDRRLHDTLLAGRGRGGRPPTKNGRVSPSRDDDDDDDDDDDEWVKNVFTVGLGLATVPRIMLRGTEGEGKSKRDCSCSGVGSMIDDPENDASSPTVSSHVPVMGKVMLYHEQIRVSEAVRSLLSMPERREYARQLVRMYRYMYRHRVLHCDIGNLAHFSYRLPSRTALLTDFERYDVLSGNYHGSKFRWQTLQLIAVIGNVCNGEGKVVGGGGHREEFPIVGCCSSRWKLDSMNETVYAHEAMALLGGCEFDTNFTSRALLSSRTTEDSTGAAIRRVYEDLFKWAGMDE